MNLLLVHLNFMHLKYDKKDHTLHVRLLFLLKSRQDHIKQSKVAYGRIERLSEIMQMMTAK
jgi:hypothetical protein